MKIIAAIRVNGGSLQICGPMIHYFSLQFVRGYSVVVEDGFITSYRNTNVIFMDYIINTRVSEIEIVFCFN